MVKSIELSSVVSKASDLLDCETGGEVLILSLRNDTYYGLAPVAARIWLLLREPITVAKLRDQLVGEYEVSVAQCSEELLLFLEQLRSAGMVEVLEPGS